MAIEYYLDEEKERDRIADASYKRTIKEHTYEKRFKYIFKCVGL
ncbi:MAG: glycosyltransferase family protein [Candidatus Micrarchaeaceae archaeon]